MIKTFVRKISLILCGCLFAGGAFAEATEHNAYVINDSTQYALKITYKICKAPPLSLDFKCELPVSATIPPKDSSQINMLTVPIMSDFQKESFNFGIITASLVGSPTPTSFAPQELDDNFRCNMIDFGKSGLFIISSYGNQNPYLTCTRHE